MMYPFSITFNSKVFYINAGLSSKTVFLCHWQSGNALVSDAVARDHQFEPGMALFTIQFLKSGYPLEVEWKFPNSFHN
jgi:hypothetical protein